MISHIQVPEMAPILAPVSLASPRASSLTEFVESVAPKFAEEKWTFKARNAEVRIQIGKNMVRFNMILNHFQNCYYRIHSFCF